MKKNIKELILSIAIGTLFSFIIIWYFSYQILGLILLPSSTPTIKLYLSFAFSIFACLSLLKKSIEIETKKNSSFSLVARNPNAPIYKDKLSCKKFTTRLFLSASYTVFISLPLFVAAIIKSFSEQENVFDIYFSFITKYWLLYFVIFGISLFISFVIVPSYRNWHWTKPQF